MVVRWGIHMDKTSKIPLYLQLMRELIKKINEGTYVEHNKIPYKREVSNRNEISRVTVMQAFQELEREGYIYKLHGKGTFVATKSYNQKLVNLYSFTEEMSKTGKKPTTR